MARTTLMMVAARTKLIVKSGFNNYDVCFNPYVGCEFGCKYCYVRFFVKDKERGWGDFVRIREHVVDDLPKELGKGSVRIKDGRIQALDADGSPVIDERGRAVMVDRHVVLPIPSLRLVIGTMTDPYQPAEVKHRITRTALEMFSGNDFPRFRKVGIFTRSPLVLQDIELIKKLPSPRVHVTLSPYPDHVTRIIEPMTASAERRWQIIERLLEAGIRVHVNVAPVMPGLSEPMVEEWVQRLSKLPVAEYFVDPMQPYRDSFLAFAEACNGVAGIDWSRINDIMTDKDRYHEWKVGFKNLWDSFRVKYAVPTSKTLPIWCDHENDVWVDMRTDKQMDMRLYGDEA